MKVKPLLAVIAGILILGMGLWGCKQMLRERSSWSQTIRQVNGGMLQVRLATSQYRYFGHPHVFGFGGGDPWEKLTFTWKGADRRWEGPYIPICLQLDDESPHLIVFDRETDFSQITFRYYGMTNEEWEERPFHSFPKHLALQNLWVEDAVSCKYARDDLEIRDYRTVSSIDPTDTDFQDSLTARVWCCLVKNEQYWQNSPERIDEALLADYKARHMTSKTSR